MTADTFSLDAYARLLQAIAAAGYTFARFDRPATAERVFYLRHDVDVSPLMARAMGRSAAAAGVAASFFFLVNGETYDVFSEQTREIIRELRAAGHAVGLHIDQRVFGDTDEGVATTVAWFDRFVEPIDHVVSFHRPDPAVLGRSYPSVVNAYAPEFFGAGRYFSDSRRNAAFWVPLTEALAAGVPQLQLLLHPCWWYAVDGVPELYELLVARRRWEVDTFLATNFTAVFGQLVTEGRGDADRSPGV